MRLRSLRAKQTKRFKVTTKRNKAHSVAPNLLNRDFGADRPNQKWLTDITYILTLEGWLYLAAVLDLYSRRIIGWAMLDRMTSDLTVDALKMAIVQRQPELALLHHSDQGSQYTDGTYQALLKDHGIQVSMNGVGSWYDNAPMESFFGTLKSEWVYHRVYRTRDEARSDIFYYIKALQSTSASLLAGLSQSRRVRTDPLNRRELGLTLCPPNRGKIGGMSSCEAASHYVYEACLYGRQRR